MLIYDLKIIGNRFYEIRSKKLMSRMDVAEKAELSDRTYADIERGNVNMRLETLLKICSALSITPNDVLVENDDVQLTQHQLMDALKDCSGSEKETALKLLNVYINSLN